MSGRKEREREHEPDHGGVTAGLIEGKATSRYGGHQLECGVHIGDQVLMVLSSGTRRY